LFPHGRFLNIKSLYSLIFPRHGFELGQWKNRSVFTHVLVTDVAAAADADTTFHAHFKGEDKSAPGEIPAFQEPAG